MYDVNSGICCKFENIDAHSADHPLINQVNVLSPTSTISYFNFQSRSLTPIFMSIIKAIQLLLAYRSELSELKKNHFCEQCIACKKRDSYGVILCSYITAKKN